MSEVESFLVQERDLKKTSAVDLSGHGTASKRGQLKACFSVGSEAPEIQRHSVCGQGLHTGSGRRANEPSDSSRIAVWKAGEAGLDLKGSVCSDIFPIC